MSDCNEVKKRRVLSKYFREGPYKYTNYIHSARKRGIEMQMSESEMIHLYHGNCFYCGKKSASEELNGVDRVDSSRNYTKDNCVSCCKYCNYMKGKLKVNHFLDLAQEIANRAPLIRMALSNDLPL